MSDDARAIIQMATLLLSVTALVQMFVLCRRGVVSWRVVLVPAVIFVEVAVFYFFVIFDDPLFDFSIGHVANFISAMIRLQSAAFVVTFLSYHLYKKVLQHRD